MIEGEADEAGAVCGTRELKTANGGRDSPLENHIDKNR
jgi:hypothetical protein